MDDGFIVQQIVAWRKRTNHNEPRGNASHLKRPGKQTEDKTF